MTTITTLGMIILVLLICGAFFAGLGVGSFHTKRKAEAIMRMKGWLSASEGSFSQMWNDIKGRF